ncbi:MAG TPA: hypothetical protein VF765_06355 [Polyangiaceae bacterium]
MIHENAPETNAPGAEAQPADEKKATTLVDTLFDIGLTWAEFGVGQGKRALETSAKTLEKVAQSLHELQLKLRKDTTSAS